LLIRGHLAVGTSDRIYCSRRAPINGSARTAPFFGLVDQMRAQSCRLHRSAPLQSPIRSIWLRPRSISIEFCDLGDQFAPSQTPTHTPMHLDSRNLRDLLFVSPAGELAWPDAGAALHTQRVKPEDCSLLAWLFFAAVCVARGHHRLIISVPAVDPPPPLAGAKRPTTHRFVESSFL